MSIFEFDDVEQDLSKTETRPQSTHVGLISMGKVVDGNVTVLPGWRIATGNKQLSEDLGRLFDAPVVETDSTKEEFIDVLTDKERLEVILSGPSAIYGDYKQFSNGKLKHHCDGKSFLSGEDPRTGEPRKGLPCGCPTSLADKKALAKAEEGPSPSIEVKLHLADDPELGEFLWKTGSWGFAKDLYKTMHALNINEGEQLFRLEMEYVSFIAKNGPRKGKTVSYTQPKLVWVKSLNEAIADEPDF